MTTYAHAFDTPVNRVFVAVDEEGALTHLDFLSDGRSFDTFVKRIDGDVQRSASRCRSAQEAVEAYFAGERAEFDLPTAARGSEFQHTVWREVQKIPFGSTASYGEIARRLGRPGASRAVGRANATNPICLVVPCHRVVGADGSLTGFAGGVDIKRVLLELEAGYSQASLPEVATAR